MDDSIYSQINSNKQKTYLIMLGFVVIIAILGYVFGIAFGGDGYGYSYAIMAFVFSIVSTFISFFYSDKMVLGISGAKKITREENSTLYGMVENLCIGAGIKKVPDLYVMNDSAINAFATGRDPDHASIAVTSGTLDRLSKRELEGVLAHELSHVKNYDIRLMAITSILVGVITLIANIMLRSQFSSRDDKNSNAIFLVVGFVLALLSPLVAQVIQLAVSRSREYLADSSGALLTRDPKGLAEALKKIAADKEPLEVANEATAHLYISNPLKKGINAGMFANLFSTHPPVQERIKRLEAM